MKRGEGPIVFKSNVEYKWTLFIDEYGLRGYIPSGDDGSGFGRMDDARRVCAADHTTPWVCIAGYKLRI